MSKTLDIVAIVGSLRRDSLTRRLVRSFDRLLPATVGIEIVGIGELPLYQDMDSSPPTAWTDVESRRKALGKGMVATEMRIALLRDTIPVSVRGLAVWADPAGAHLGRQDLNLTRACPVSGGLSPNCGAHAWTILRRGAVVPDGQLENRAGDFGRSLCSLEPMCSQRWIWHFRSQVHIWRISAPLTSSECVTGRRRPPYPCRHRRHRSTRSGRPWRRRKPPRPERWGGLRRAEDVSTLESRGVRSCR